MTITFETTLEDFQSDLWGCHIKVSTHHAQKFIKGTERRVMCQLNEGKKFHAGLIPNKEFGYFININKAIRNAHQLSTGDKVKVTLSKDGSRYGIEVSEEFLAALEMDPQAADLFHALTPGKQRSLIHICTVPKMSETRLKKAMVILSFLKINNGRLDFNLLMQAFREAY